MTSVFYDFLLNNLEKLLTNKPKKTFVLSEVSSANMTTSGKLSSFFVQLSLMAIAGLIIFRTVKQVGVVLYTFHPTLMAVGVSLVSFKIFNIFISYQFCSI